MRRSADPQIDGMLTARMAHSSVGRGYVRRLNGAPAVVDPSPAGLHVLGGGDRAVASALVGGAAAAISGTAPERWLRDDGASEPSVDAAAGVGARSNVVRARLRGRDHTGTRPVHDLRAIVVRRNDHALSLTSARVACSTTGLRRKVTTVERCARPCSGSIPGRTAGFPVVQALIAQRDSATPRRQRSELRVPRCPRTSGLPPPVQQCAFGPALRTYYPGLRLSRVACGSSSTTSLKSRGTRGKRVAYDKHGSPIVRARVGGRLVFTDATRPTPRSSSGRVT